jgi:hypothetical protein
MRLSTICLAALRLALALAVILLFSTNILAQHSAGGGGSSSGASSGGGGGGSHGGSSAGSFSSASSSSHSSGGSVSHRSTANAPTSGSASSRSGVRGAQPKALNTVRQTNAAVPARRNRLRKEVSFPSCGILSENRCRPKLRARRWLICGARSVSKVPARSVRKADARELLSPATAFAIPARRENFGVVAPACSRFLSTTAVGCA